jgi:hypothetical protein
MFTNKPTFFAIISKPIINKFSGRGTSIYNATMLDYMPEINLDRIFTCMNMYKLRRINIVNISKDNKLYEFKAKFEEKESKIEDYIQLEY